MSKAYLQGFYDYFVNQFENPYIDDEHDYIDWNAGWSAASSISPDFY